MEASANAPVKKKAFRLPHVFAIMMILTLIFAVLSYVMPSSSYDFVDATYEINGVEKTRSVVDPTSWVILEEDTNVTLMQFLTSFMRGSIEVADIIFYIFLVCGSFFIINETGALTAGVGGLIRKLGKRDVLIIPILTLIFAILGATAGIFEEMLCFIPILLPIFVAAGYDSLMVVAVVMGGCIAGWAGTTTNPFTLAIAQGISGLPVYSGMGYHAIMFVCFTGFTCFWLTRYALKLKKDPTRSIMYEADHNNPEIGKLSLKELPEFNTRRIIIVVLVVLTIAAMMYGVLKLGWYFNELVALFMVMALIATFVYGKGISWYAENLAKGMSTVVEGAMVVGFARSILVVMNDSSIIHTILHGMANVVSKLPSAITVVGQYIFQVLLNYIVPSGSGQATVSMPIMAPLADIAGITRQTAVCCEVIGDALSNVFTPTSGAFMAGLGMAGIPWQKWAKFWWKAICIQYAIGLVLVLVAHWINLGPF